VASARLLTMKILVRCTLLGVASLAAAKSRSKTGTRGVSKEALPFGPAGCASVTRSKSGTCVLTTSCDGEDLSRVEFAFNCRESKKQGGGLVRHSYGQGGFDSLEDFDTGVKCSRCSPSSPLSSGTIRKRLAPSAPRDEPAALHLQNRSQLSAEPTASQTTANETDAVIKSAVKEEERGVAKVEKMSRSALEKASEGEEEQQEAEDEEGEDKEGEMPAGAVSRFGPKNCVSAYKSPEGHCVVKTACSTQEISGFDFGLLCVDASGSPVRHIFGKGSFAAKETFDTLIPCQRCLGPNDEAGMGLPAEVAALKYEVGSLQYGLQNISGSLRGDSVETKEVIQEVSQMKTMMKTLQGAVTALYSAVFQNSTVPPGLARLPEDHNRAAASAARGLEQVPKVSSAEAKNTASSGIANTAPAVSPAAAPSPAASVNFLRGTVASPRTQLRRLRHAGGHLGEETPPRHRLRNTARLHQQAHRHQQRAQAAVSSATDAQIKLAVGELSNDDAAKLLTELDGPSGKSKAAKLLKELDGASVKSKGTVHRDEHKRPRQQRKLMQRQLRHSRRVEEENADAADMDDADDADDEDTEYVDDADGDDDSEDADEWLTQHQEEPAEDVDLEESDEQEDDSRTGDD